MGGLTTRPKAAEHMYSVTGKEQKERKTAPVYFTSDTATQGRHLSYIFPTWYPYVTCFFFNFEF